jgi:putative cardiolipin synthase
MFRHALRAFLLAAAALALAVVSGRMIFRLPDISHRTPQHAMPATPQTALGRAMLDAAGVHPGLTGLQPLRDGVDALQSRLVLARKAEASIDAQYYIWHDDVSGRLLLDELRQAAERGVRVRLLLDDNGVPGLDDTLAALDALPGFDIRLFNPSTVRRPKAAGYAFDFPRMNRRMHNKSFVVDGAAAIIGGRNIGDEYFQIRSGSFYVDLDVLAIGAVVPDTARAFDDYWNSASVFAVDQIVTGGGAGLEAFAAGVATARSSPAARLFDAVESAADRFAAGGAELEWTGVTLVVDDPVKGTGTARRDQLLVTRLGAILGGVTRRLDLVSAYFVPGRSGTEWLTGLATAGVEVRILTNALAATDVALVHAGYARYRRELLAAGVSLFEMKPGHGAPSGREELAALGLSGASLHAKTFAVDGTRAFIGSFNFDPRSALLNCEMGFLIESPSIAAGIHGVFDREAPPVTYRPGLADGRLVWTDTGASGTPTTTDVEPDSTWLDRRLLTIFGWLPIERLL